MRRLASSIMLAFVVVTASCGNDDGADTSANGCTPGEQQACACPGGGAPGVQVCDAAGLGFGACMGCDGGTEESSGATSIDPSATTVDADPTTDMTMTTAVDSTGPVADSGEVTGPPTGTETGVAGFEWVWVDHGGPAFLPPPCAGGAGVVNGSLVDPQAFFNDLVGGTDPNTWEAVMNSIEPSLWGCGVGQQRDSGGAVRGRLFLPTEGCPDASPPADDPEAMFLGVRQERACWVHPVDVIAEL